METSVVSALSGKAMSSRVASMDGDRSEMLENSDVSLSARERTIVLLMGHGLSNKMIARTLSIAPETVKSHAKRIFLKLTVQSRAQAVYRASMLDLI
jgi:LuxR family transcriptional regulator, maltose regulon positive regulatory protein